MLFQLHKCLLKKKKFLILSHIFFERTYMLVFLKFLLGRTVSVVSCTEEAAVDLQLLTFVSVGHQSWLATFWRADCEDVSVDPFVTF